LRTEHHFRSAVAGVAAGESESALAKGEQKPGWWCNAWCGSGAKVGADYCRTDAHGFG
jgi:hypothetical protein